MREPFELLPKEEIAKWLKSLSRPGDNKITNRVTVAAIANYMDTTVTSISHLIRVPSMSVERQRLLSKIIAMVENGQMVAEYQPRRKGARGRTKKTLVRVVPENQKPTPPKYQIQTDAAGKPWVRPVARVKPLGEMPQFGSLLTKRK